METEKKCKTAKGLNDSIDKMLAEKDAEIEGLKKKIRELEYTVQELMR